MNEFLELMEHLSERYTSYQHLLVKVEEAIERRNAEDLGALEGDCRSVLADVQVSWAVFEEILTQSPEVEPSAIPALHQLRDLIEQTRAQAQTNELALSLWMGEVGRDLGRLRLRRQTLHGYAGDRAPRQRYLTLNA